jgi:hypothetical protein
MSQFKLCHLWKRVKRPTSNWSTNVPNELCVISCITLSLMLTYCRYDFVVTKLVTLHGALLSCKYNVWGLFEKFIDSTYYSELELCGGTVTACFWKYLPWQVMHFLQHCTHFFKMCCRLLISSKFLASELPFCGWKSPEIAWGEIWTAWWMF